MKKCTKIIAAVCIVLCAVFYVMLIDSPVPKKTGITVTLDDLRSAALSKDGALPERINALNIADGEFPPGFAVAGDFHKKRVPFYVWQIIYPGKAFHSVMVDSAQAEVHCKNGATRAKFYKDKFDEMQRALLNASLIIVTHEHADHTGGIALSPYLEKISSKTWITPEQKTGPFMKSSLFPEGALAKIKDLRYESLYVLAPGVVLMKTPGHTPGHQIVFVHLANGKEYIIAGDIGWNIKNIDTLRGRPLATALLLKENRTQSADQLRWLNDMQKQNISLLVTHDFDHTQLLVKKGLIHEGLE